jgi:hypothetical protein
LSNAITLHHAVHAGACAKQAGRTQQEGVECEQIVMPHAPEDGTHLGLLCWRDLKEGC